MVLNFDKYCFSFQEKYEETKKKLATAQDAKNKKELEEALSTLSVEEQELKKREEEFKTKEKVSYFNYKCLAFMYKIINILNFKSGNALEC